MIFIAKEMAIDEFLKDLPSRNKANFSSFLKQNGKPIVSRFSKQTDDEKRIIFDTKPLLLRYLQSNWNNPVPPTSSNRPTRSERKRTSDISNDTTEESESTTGSRVKTRRRE